MNRKIALLTLLAFFIQGCSGPMWSMGEGKREVAAASGESWAVSGYLAENPKQKVYVTIKGNRIESVSSSAPRVPVVETDSVIFPGFTDMHGHVKYNILPLWDLAQSQFLNRFEWRTKFPPYKDAVSANMRGVRGDVVCAAVRWAEIKAAAGGATAIQGIGGDSKCAKGFGVNNLEIPDDMGGVKIRSMTDMVMPDLIGKVYVTMIEPEIKKGRSYDQAYEKMLKDQGVTDWVNSFVKDSRDLGTAFRLLVGDDLGARGSSESDFRSAEAGLKKYLSGKPYEMKDKDITKQLASMKKWIFGDRGKNSYLSARKDEKAAMDFLSKGGVLTVSSSVRRYIGMFETSVRQSALNYFSERGPKAIVAHVAEGMRNDAYNRLEYQYAKAFGLNQKGLVMIHAVGLDRKDFQDAARNDISIVWSPFSNLLLYGETLDVAAAKSAHVNIALGSDWTPTGSKHILDELKLARRYLDKNRIKEISNRDLIDMVTVNSAKALQLEKEMGQVKDGYIANLTLISCPRGADPYDCAVSAEEKDISMVVANGHAFYGDVDLMNSLARALRDNDDPEVYKAGGSCRFEKAVRYQAPTDYDASIRSKGLNMRSIPKLEQQLKAALAKSESKKQKVGLDPLLKCEDDKYAKRVDAYIERELDQNNRKRASSRRGEYKLSDDWTPFTLDETEGEEENQ